MHLLVDGRPVLVRVGGVNGVALGLAVMFGGPSIPGELAEEYKGDAICRRVSLGREKKQSHMKLLN